MTFLFVLFHPVKIKLRYPCHLRITKKSLMSFDTIEANWRTYLMFPLYQTFGPRHKSENDGGEPGIHLKPATFARMKILWKYVVLNILYVFRLYD